MPIKTAEVKVRKVPYGRGVFADRAFRKGQKVGELRGRVIDDADYWSEYCIDLGGSLSLEPFAPFRFLNHNCEANCQLYLIEWETDDGSVLPPTVYLETLRAIRLGEELTIDYCWPADGAIKCLCGAANCRGWVVDPAELDQIVPSR